MSNNIVQPTSVEREIAGVRISLSTGQMARQAQGSVTCTIGGSSAFAAVCHGKPFGVPSFFPLTCDYREKTQAAGKIPGGFFKREGRPTTKEILTMRLIDRSIRPMFADGYMQEVQVMTQALGYDGENNTDIAAMIGAFTAVRLAGLPFETTLGATRIGMVDGELVAFPKDPDLRADSTLNLVVAGHSDAIAMVEASAKELSESEMIDALEMAHNVIKEVIDLSNELIEKSNVTEVEYTAPEPDTESADAVAPWADRITEALYTEGKHARYGAVDAVRETCLDELTEGIDDEEELKAKKGALKSAFRTLTGQCERETILNGKRTDGRKSDEIRDIWIVPDYVAQHHGSVLFTRGETQALVSATLGTPDDEQIIDGIEEEYRKNFYLHYNFPPYSVGETKRIFGPSRREIGHGMLAERALQAVLPPKDKFPYTIRINSDITESNGSSSMASVCGGCLSMMLAGVPVTQPVAGIAMGLVQEGDRMAILSDILGSEDHTGDMDFKVAGTGLGITALQMDIKIKGVSRALLEEALAQASEGLKHILREMLTVVDRPRSQVADHAPRFEAIKIPGEKIGFLIGPGGKNIKGLQEEFGVRVSIIDDDGHVQVFGTDSAKVAGCIARIQATCETPKIGAKYTGTVKSIRDFGAFVEILPGVEGLLHISELSTEYVENVNDVVSTGDSVEVVITNVDDRGKVRLMRQEVVDARNAVEA